ELIGRSVLDVTHPDDAAEDLELRGELLAGHGRRYSREKRYRHAAGHYIWGQVHVALIRDAVGRPAYFVSQIHDVSQRKHAEARYRSLVENIPIGLFRVTPEGRFLDVNPALMQILGYADRNELLAVDVNALYVEPEDRDRFVRTITENDPAPGS